MNSFANKVTPLREAITRYVKPEAHISVGGFTLNRNPMAAVYEIIRQGVKGLHVYAHSNGQAVDELIGAGGVNLVVTDLAVMRFDRHSGRMYLDQYYPGVSIEQVLDKMEFAVDVSRAVQASPPTAEELAVLRSKCDPQRLILD